MVVTNKLAVSDVMRITDSINTGPRIVQWKTKRIAVRPLLTFKEMMEFVDEVVEACIDKNSGCFLAESVDFMFRTYVVSMYAGVELPPDVEQRYKFLYATDFYDIVLSIANKAQIDALRGTVEHYAETLMK